MKKICVAVLALGLALSAQAQYQVSNSNFEEWQSVISPEGVAGQAPIGWHSYLTATGTHRGLANQQGSLLSRSNETRPGSTGHYSAQIKARALLAKNLYGNITTGCPNVTGMNPKDGTSYYNYTDPSNAEAHMSFTGRPDSVKVWVKLTASRGNDGLISAILHSDGTYKTPIVQNESFVSTAKPIAQAVQMVSATGQWKLYSLPLGYSATANPAYALISFQTSNVPGEGDKTATMLIDDMEFVYNSELASATYAGVSLLDKSGVDEVYDALKLKNVKANGVGATVSTTFDESTHVLTITVKGGDIEQNAQNQHTYTFQFKAPGTDPDPDDPDIGPDNPEDDPNHPGTGSDDPVTPPSHQWPVAGTSATYTDDLQVTVNSVINPAQKYDINLHYKEDGLVDLNLDNFVLVSAGDQIPIGNIVLKDVQLEWKREEGRAVIDKSEDVYIEAGQLEGVDFWMGPMLNSMYGAIPVTMNGYMTDDKLFLNIYINMMNTSLRQMIYVTFGNAFEPSPDPDDNPESGDNPEPGDNPEDGDDPVTPPTPSYTALPISGHKVYSDNILIDINGSVTGPLPADVTVTYHEGSIDFALYDFSMMSDGNEMFVGNINIPNLAVSHIGGGVYTYSFHDMMEISQGTFSEDEYGDPVDWLGPMLGPLELGLDGKITADKLYVTIDIPLASMGQIIHVVFGTDEFETAIKSISESRPANGVTYDLSGRRVSRTLKGKVYIENGKKIVKH